MAPRDTVLGIVQAGGKGSRMDVLTRERAKPVLPFAGSYKLIDFALSSLANSGIEDVWVSVQYQVSSLDRYLSGGRPWDLDRNRGGFRRVVPESGSGPASEEGFAHGNADLLLRMRADLEHWAPDTIVVTSADHVFAMDLRPVIAAHQEAGAACTLVTAEVTRAEAAHNVVVLESEGRVYGIETKPSAPSSGTVATELFVYDRDALLAAVDALRAERSRVKAAEGDESDDSGLGDFGDLLLPRLIETGPVLALPIEGYWRDVGRPDAYLLGHRELLDGKVDALARPNWPIMSHWPDLPPARFGASALVRESLVSSGCDVGGEVTGSVLSPGVVVEPGAVVRGSVLLDGAYVESGAVVQTAVLDCSVRVGRKAVVGADIGRRRAKDEDIVLVGMDASIGAGVVIEPGGRLEPGTVA